MRHTSVVKSNYELEHYAGSQKTNLTHFVVSRLLGPPPETTQTKDKGNTCSRRIEITIPDPRQESNLGLRVEVRDSTDYTVGTACKTLSLLDGGPKF